MKSKRSKFYAVHRLTPDNIEKTVIVGTKREAGQHVAYVLHYNANVDRKTATQAGMAFEKNEILESHGYRFTMQPSPTPHVWEFEKNYRYA